MDAQQNEAEQRLNDRTQVTVISYMNIKERVALACRIAYSEGLHEVLGHEPSGHISVRDESNRIIMPGHLHGLGRGLKDIAAEDIIVVDINGKRIEGKRVPVEEVVIHTSIYNARPDVRSVAHLHLPAAGALACTDKTLLPISLKSCHFAEGLVIFETDPTLIDNMEIARAMAEKLGQRKALIHRGHGAVTVGRNLEEAVLLAIYLEGAARDQLLAEQLGKITKTYDVEKAIRFAESHNLSKHQELWQYFENKWKNKA